MDDGRVAFFGVAAHVLPDVEHRTARRVDQRASAPVELLEHRDGHAERGQDDDVRGAEAIDGVNLVAQETDALGAQVFVHVRVVDDFAREEHLAVRKSLARLVRVIDRAVHAVAEPELSSEVHRQPSGLVGEILRLHALDEGAVIVLGQHAGDGLLHVETFTEDQGGHG